MIKNYLKSAVRNIVRNKGYSFINIFGLAIGIAGSLAIFLWISDEVSFDKFHTNAETIYRCYRQVIWNGETRFSETTSAPIGPAVAERTPGIKEYVRIFPTLLKMEYGTGSYSGRGIYADSDFFNVFSFPLESGDMRTALEAPRSIVLTQKTATALFGRQNPIGRTLKNGLTVTGVAEDVPANSSIQFDFVLPFSYAVQVGLVEPDEWWSFGYDTYFLLDKNADVNKISDQIKDMYKDVDSESTIELYLQPLTDIHLRGLEGSGRIVYVYVFSIIAILLLAVACINFMNLATARASKRAKEIGLRKTAGAFRSQLIVQLMIESALQTIIAMLIAVVILEAALPYLSEFFGKQIVLNFSIDLIFVLIAIVLLTALAAGSYPALILSSYRPITVLRGGVSSSGNKSMNLVRKILVVFQFTISTALIFGALVIYGQLNFINHKDLGISRENVVCLRADNLDKDYQSFENELKKYPGIQNVSAVYEPPAWCGWHIVGFDYEGKPEDHDVRAGVDFVDYDYVDLFGLQIVEGRNFSRQYATDAKEAYIVNEAAVRAMQMDAPIGKSIGLVERPGKIIGVVKDFHFASLHEAITPLILTCDKSEFDWLCIKLSPNDIQGSIGYINRVWNQFRPGENFNPRFFADLLGREYKIEIQTGAIVLVFTIITMFVACLGLFGLAAYSAERRTKEIGIRKVLGASTTGIIGLLTREFILFVLLGNVVAIPIAFYLTSRWLMNFAYRIEPGWLFVLIAGGLAMMIALLTVSYQAIKAAWANPVKAIKYE
jgi:putative ABC transport system permease protein